MTIFLQKNKSCSVKSQSAMTVQCTLRGCVAHFKRKNAKKLFFTGGGGGTGEIRTLDESRVRPPCHRRTNHGSLTEGERLGTLDLLVLTGLDELLNEEVYGTESFLLR
jgi:hypothetical protein